MLIPVPGISFLVLRKRAFSAREVGYLSDFFKNTSSKCLKNILKNDW